MRMSGIRSQDSPDVLKAGASRFRISMCRRLNQAEVAAFSTIEDIYPRAPRVEKNEKLPMRHFQLQDRFIHKHRFDWKTFGPDDSMFLMFVLVGRLGMQDLLVQVLHDVFSRPVVLPETRLL